MSIEQAERLKREWTDQYVVVRKGVPELARFAGRTGRVKTVNMNGYALVEFDSSEDIGWYDIATDFLTQVDEPDPNAQPAAEEKPAEKPKAAPKPAAAPAASGGLSPLELARQQAAGGGAAPAAKPAGLSPLELARQQGASGGAAPAAETPAAPEPAAEPEPIPEPELEAAPEPASAAAAAGAPEQLSVDEILARCRQQDGS